MTKGSTVTAKMLLKLRHLLRNELDVETRAALQGRQSLAIQPSADALERIVSGSDRELAMAGLHRRSGLVRLIRAALDRLEDGTYGVCQSCGKPIPTKRLHAVPWTPFCIRCQEAADEQNEQTWILSPAQPYED